MRQSDVGATQRRHAAVKGDVDLDVALASLGYAAFRPPQREVVETLLRGRDAIVLMPTGGGKSLTYQLPAVVRPGGTVVVVSPLVALMHDQVAALRKRGVTACALWSGAGDGVTAAIYAALEARDVRVLFITPEGARGARLGKALAALHAARALTCFAVDEAHSISSWGHSFRPAYRGLDALRTRYPGVPLVALTATATSAVLADIAASLGMAPDARVFRRSFDRPNLAYRVVFKELLESPLAHLVDALRRTGVLAPAAAGSGGGGAVRPAAARLSGGGDGSGGGGGAGTGAGAGPPPEPPPPAPSLAIVYVGRREDADWLARELTACGGGVRAVAYHAGMRDDERSAAQTDWMAGAAPVCCATVAFGMGIDAPGVRLVAHWSLPASVTGYYQEAGRGGRDGAPAQCVLYYSREERRVLAWVTQRGTADAVARKRGGASAGTAAAAASRSGGEDLGDAPSPLAALDAVAAFCETARCRRVAILEHFGEARDPAAAATGGAPPRRDCAGVAGAQRCDYCVDPEGAETLTELLRLGATAGSMRGLALDAAAAAARGRGDDEHIARAMHGGGGGGGGGGWDGRGGRKRLRRDDGGDGGEHDGYGDEDDGGDGDSDDDAGVAGILPPPLLAPHDRVGGGRVRAAAVVGAGAKLAVAPRTHSEVPRLLGAAAAASRVADAVPAVLPASLPPPVAAAPHRAVAAPAVVGVRRTAATPALAAATAAAGARCVPSQRPPADSAAAAARGVAVSVAATAGAEARGATAALRQPAPARVPLAVRPSSAAAPAAAHAPLLLTSARPASMPSQVLLAPRAPAPLPTGGLAPRGALPSQAAAPAAAAPSTGVRAQATAGGAGSGRAAVAGGAASAADAERARAAAARDAAVAAAMARIGRLEAAAAAGLVGNRDVPRLLPRRGGGEGDGGDDDDDDEGAGRGGGGGGSSAADRFRARLREHLSAQGQ